MAFTPMVPPTTRQLVDALNSAVQQFERNPDSVDVSGAIAELKRIVLHHLDGLEVDSATLKPREQSSPSGSELPSSR